MGSIQQAGTLEGFGNLQYVWNLKRALKCTDYQVRQGAPASTMLKRSQESEKSPDLCRILSSWLRKIRRLMEAWRILDRCVNRAPEKRRYEQERYLRRHLIVRLHLAVSHFLLFLLESANDETEHLRIEMRMSDIASVWSLTCHCATVDQRAVAQERFRTAYDHFVAALILFLSRKIVLKIQNVPTQCKMSPWRRWRNRKRGIVNGGIFLGWCLFVDNLNDV